MTQPTVTTYIEYLSPGSFYSETEIRPVIPEPALDAAAAPAHALAFRYFDIADTTVEVGGEPVATRSGELNPTARYYIDADELSYADVEALDGDNRILLANMRGNGWDPILRCRTGNFQPKEPGDVLLRTGDR